MTGVVDSGKAAVTTNHMGIVIVNFRTAQLAIDCLEAIAGELGARPVCRVVVVDNASGDGSVEDLREAIAQNRWQDWVSVLPSQRNGGFAYGNNVGIRKLVQELSDLEYIMLLNPDAVIDKGAISSLLEFMEVNKEVGVAGSMLVDPDGEPQCSAHRDFSPLGELEAAARLGILSRLLKRHAVSLSPRQLAHECDWVSGASMIIRRQVLDQVGLFDEGFFLYFEEADFCRRVKQSGWRVWFVPDSRVMHVEGASTGIRTRAQRRPGYWYESRRRYFVKHLGIGGLILSDALWALGRASLALRRAARLGGGRGEGEPKWFARDLLWGDVCALVGGNMPRPREVAPCPREPGS